VSDGHALQKGLYYSVAQECLGLCPTAAPAARVILFCAAHLATALAQELDDDIIEASAQNLWAAYPLELERLLRLAARPKSPQENIWQLSSAIEALYPPNGKP